MFTVSIFSTPRMSAVANVLADQLAAMSDEALLADQLPLAAKISHKLWCYKAKIKAAKNDAGRRAWDAQFAMLTIQENRLQALRGKRNAGVRTHLRRAGGGRCWHVGAVWGWR